MYTNDDIRRGLRVLQSGAAIAAGLAVIQTSSGTVTKPTDGKQPSFVAISTATASGESVECQPLTPLDEVRLHASAAISAGDICEFILSGDDAGEIRTLVSGVGRVMALEAATAAGDFIRCLVLPDFEPSAPAPGALNATGTLTLALIQTGIITSSTAAAVTATIDTGALLDAGGKPIRGFYDFSVINTGASNDFTIQVATGVTNVGSLVVQESTSARFRLIRTAAETWILYRLAV